MVRLKKKKTSKDFVQLQNVWVRLDCVVQQVLNSCSSLKADFVPRLS